VTAPRLARAALIAATVLLAASAIWTVLVRSTVPIELDGSVVDVTVRNRTSGGAEVYLVELDGDRTLIVDQVVARSLRPGDRLSKQAWSSHLVIATRGDANLWRSRELVRMIVLMVLLLLEVGYLTYKRDGLQRALSIVASAVDRRLGRISGHTRR
jgi:hypothetical protein